MGTYQPYEVFVQRTHAENHLHVGSVLAATPEMALQVARENFLRRERAVNLWVVLQENIHATRYEDEIFFARELDKTYRDVTGYADNARRWKAFKEKALSLEEIIDDVRRP